MNCIHFLPLTLTNGNSVNKIWLLGVELMLLGNQTQRGILFRLPPAGDIAVSDSHFKGKDDFSSIDLKQPELTSRYRRRPHPFLY